ncbi:uncharacterized protein [Ptychodera flava]|uniref:uncharacterized protein n=1 Tax=Ptychodera flava TaxID=63121 RepID=UPI00396A962D
MKYGSNSVGIRVVEVSKLCFSLEMYPILMPNRTQWCLSFESGDSFQNLSTALDRFREQLHELKALTWKEKTFRLFGFGDYEYLCKIYGLSGAGGRHFCLWCHVTQEESQIPRHLRTSQPRSIDSLIKDHADFLAEGQGKLKNAKEYNNAINNIIFEIPISQVCVPSLHLDLGIFLRFYNMFEDDIAKLQKKIDPSGTLNLVQSLDKTLQRMNVKRQAYHGKSFVGNHVHKCLQDGNIDMLTNAVIEEVKAVSPEYQDEATTICTKFNKLLKMFAKCHAGYSKCDYMEAEEIKELETNIDCLMASTESNFQMPKCLLKCTYWRITQFPGYRNGVLAVGSMGNRGENMCMLI